MRRQTRVLGSVIIMLALAGAHTPAHAQFGKLKDKLKKKVEERVERKTDQAMDNALNTVECVVSDAACIEKARAEGKTVKPVEGTAAQKPGHGVWANYDFKPGDRIIFADDFSKDEVGDFPRRMEFKEGQIEIVEWNGARWLRVADGSFSIPLPETLPERFTIEFDLVGMCGRNLTLNLQEPSASVRQIWINCWRPTSSAGVRTAEINAQGSFGEVNDEKPVHIAIMADGKHVKLFANETRVVNAPNADLGRSNKIYVYMYNQMIANLKIAAGGRKLYDALAEKGRVATQGILFDIGSDRIRPESTPTLKEIGTMLKEHPELKLLIEGHTDNVGSAESNQTLSEKRAQSVRQHLIQSFGIEEARLQAKGFGASKPAASNDTPDGRQQNRRVELVKQ